MADAYQSLYRRYRSRRFSKLRGQDHVTKALRNAVREGRVGHAYLFSGPRGTGKTSTARILAKVLNCAAPSDGEPCGRCENCAAVDEGRLVDWLQEHDAASNNRVEPMRDLLEKVPLGTSGNRKVIILDEVHMLTGGAANALLKTLEEPPEHVVFVLATTDPQKVLPTIRSRTQHFEFHLLPAEELAEHVRWVIGDAGLDLGEEAVEHVVRVGGGSARDTLSALDQVAALGGVVDEQEPVEAVLAALVERDAGDVLKAVAEAVSAGRDVRVLGTTLVERLRNAFLAMMGAPDRHLPEGERDRAQALGQALGAAGLTRALEVIGESLVELSKKPDPRIVLEVALVRLTRPDVDRSLDAVLERLDRLERAMSGGIAVSPSPEPGAVHAGVTPSAARSAAPPEPPGGPADAARAELARHTGGRPGPVKGVVKKAAPGPVAAAPARPGPAAEPPPPPAAAAAPAAATAAAPAAAPVDGGLPSRDELTLAWGDAVLEGLPGGARALYRMGRFLESGDGRRARFALPNAPHRDHCEKKRSEVEAALSRHFGRPVPLELVIDDAEAGRPGPGPVGPEQAAVEEEVADVHELEDAPGPASGLERLTEAFPGAVVEEPEVRE
jgi:DNA polymerase III subunit gamma/tau